MLLEVADTQIPSEDNLTAVVILARTTYYIKKRALTRAVAGNKTYMPPFLYGEGDILEENQRAYALRQMLNIQYSICHIACEIKHKTVFIQKIDAQLSKKSFTSA
jgi:hypothetical protein